MEYIDKGHDGIFVANSCEMSLETHFDFENNFATVAPDALDEPRLLVALSLPTYRY